jgi:hypothetical protein
MAATATLTLHATCLLGAFVFIAALLIGVFWAAPASRRAHAAKMGLQAYLRPAAGGVFDDRRC